MTLTAAVRRPAEKEVHRDATWSVATECRGAAVARVVRCGSDLEVRVGDGPTGAHGHPLSAAVATLHGNGSMSVRTQAAPPALWVQSAGVWLLPSGASGPEPRPRSQDRLLLLSADALDTEPSGLVALLAMPADEVLTIPADQLLSLVLPPGGPGAAAVVWRSGGAWTASFGTESRR